MSTYIICTEESIRFEINEYTFSEEYSKQKYVDFLSKVLHYLSKSSIMLRHYARRGATDRCRRVV